MQQYQFDKIFSQMEKEFGKIKTGKEDEHTMLFFPMESNVLKIHRKNPASNSRRLREAIALVLFDIKFRYTGVEETLEKFRSEDNRKLEQALLMAFDPFTNEEIYAVIKDDMKMDLGNLSMLHDYYAEPVICLLRIKESIDTWEKQMGANGYFDFIENHMGYQVTGDNMNFSICTGKTFL